MVFTLLSVACLFFAAYCFGRGHALYRINRQRGLGHRDALVTPVDSSWHSDG